MKNFWKKYKTHIVILIYLIIIGLVGFFIARPMIQSIKDKSDKIQQKIAMQERRKEKLLELSSMRSQFEEAKKQEEKINISLNEDNVVVLIEKLEKISEETGNKIKMELSGNEKDSKKNNNLAKNSNEEKDNLAEDLPSDKYVKIKIILGGRYGNFLNFLNKIENMEFYSDVVSVAIKRASENGPGLSTNPFAKANTLNIENVPEDKDAIISQIEAVFYLESK